MRIYKILRPAEWSELKKRRQTVGAPVDVADGFVHLLTAEQVAETAARHFSGEADLILLAFDTSTLGEALKWEPSRGGALFPHLYAPLRLADVQWARPIPLGTDGHRLPDGVL